MLNKLINFVGTKTSKIIANKMDTEESIQGRKDLFSFATKAAKVAYCFVEIAIVSTVVNKIASVCRRELSDDYVGKFKPAIKIAEDFFYSLFPQFDGIETIKAHNML